MATWLGSLWFLVPLTVLVAGWRARSGRRRDVAFIAAVLGASALAHSLKLGVAWPRPALFAAWVAVPGSGSYPSSHAAQAAAVAVALDLVAGRRSAGAALVGAGSGSAVAFSRVYLQLHFLGGVIASALWVAGRTP